MASTNPLTNEENDGQFQSDTNNSNSVAGTEGSLSSQIAGQANRTPTAAPTTTAAVVGPYAQTVGATINQGATNQDRAAMYGLAGSLSNTINNPNASSVAQQQLNQSTNANIAQQMALGASRAGAVNPALALRSTLEGAGAAQQTAAGQAALLRAQEVANAQGQLGTVLNNVSGTDAGLETTQAGLTQQANLQNGAESYGAATTDANNAETTNTANLGAAVTTNGQNNQYQESMDAEAGQLLGQQQQNYLDQVNNQATLSGQAASIQQQQDAANQSFWSNIIGSTLGAVGGGLTAGLIGKH